MSRSQKAAQIFAKYSTEVVQEFKNYNRLNITLGLALTKEKLEKIKASVWLLYSCQPNSNSKVVSAFKSKLQNLFCLLEELSILF